MNKTRESRIHGEFCFLFFTGFGSGFFVYIVYKC